ncbi:hypothetical protein [Chakrabartyella piscis]|uniref:hypothetical protein n=1 Tax=Chakrabartyella piscis TaxID=2918914 RepID=UPI002958379A|nr:hypothetical protein [Chakrabartyella piscis]
MQDNIEDDDDDDDYKPVDEEERLYMEKLQEMAKRHNKAIDNLIRYVEFGEE